MPRTSQPAPRTSQPEPRSPQPMPRDSGRGRIRSLNRRPTTNSGPDSTKVVRRAREKCGEIDEKLMRYRFMARWVRDPDRLKELAGRIAEQEDHKRALHPEDK